jgi:hypothetical protein
MAFSSTGPGSQAHQFIQPDTGGENSAPTSGNDPLQEPPTAGTQGQRERATHVGSMASSFSQAGINAERLLAAYQGIPQRREEQADFDRRNRVLDMFQGHTVLEVRDILAAERKKAQPPSHEELIRRGIIKVMPKQARQ